MQRPGLGPRKGLVWAAVIMALPSLGQIAKPLGWAEACSHVGSSRLASALSTQRPSAFDGPEYVDPWALSLTGEHLGPGFGLGDEGLPLLR